MTAPIPPLHVIVKFGSDVPIDARNEALLDFEKRLRQLSGVRAEVFQDKVGDDSRLRSLMTPEQRAEANKDDREWYRQVAEDRIKTVLKK